MYQCAILLFAAFCLWSSSAIAGFSCIAKVVSVALGPISGVLQVNTGYGVHYLCKIDTEYNGVQPEICKAWYAMFLSAQASGRSIAQVYDQNAGGAQSCSELGSWTVPNPLPYYVSME